MIAIDKSGMLHMIDESDDTSDDSSDDISHESSMGIMDVLGYWNSNEL